MKIGAQLYTVREHTKTLDDFALTLEKIADIGYKSVQVSGTCAFEPQWLKEQLNRTGLTCAVTHTNAARLLESTDTVVAEHAMFGCNYIGIGLMPKPSKDEVENYIAFRNNYKAVAKRLKELGSTLMYHNHSFEFTRIGDGKLNILDQMAADFAPDELSFILDTYWVQNAGGDSVEWIKKLSGRLQCVHLKDMTYAENAVRMAPVFEGNINFDAIIEACANAGTEYLIVEQDDSYGVDPFECLAISYKNLKAKGLQ